MAVADLAVVEGGLHALPVAGADVVDNDVAGHVPERVVTTNAAGDRADDDAELDLEIERMRALRPDDRRPVGDDGIGELGEQQGPDRRVPAALGDVVVVVEPDADDLGGVRKVIALAHATLADQLALGAALLPSPLGAALGPS